MLRSILVALDGSPWSEAATTLALDWAARFEARLIGLGVLDEPSIDRGEPVPMGAYAYTKHRDETSSGARRTSTSRRRTGPTRLAQVIRTTFESLGIGAGQDVAVVTVHRDRAEADPIASDTAPADVVLEEVRRRRPGYW